MRGSRVAEEDLARPAPDELSYNDSRLHVKSEADEARLPPLPPQVEAKVAELWQHGRVGANWFYWVALLSLVNSCIAHGGAQTTFALGLGVTMIADGVAVAAAGQAPDVATAIKIMVIAFDFFVIAMVVLCGWLAGKRYLVIFAIGMFLYLLDGLIYLFFGQWMSVAIHVFALIYMWRGFDAFRRLKSLAQAYST